MENDFQYLNLLSNCLLHGEDRPAEHDRTGIATRSIIGGMMNFDLSGGKIPLLTTKKVYWKGVVAELLWFISGETDTQILKDQGVHIWDGNTSEEFLKKTNKPSIIKPGDIGAGYSFQWRNWNGDLNAWNSNKTRTGIDQLSRLMDNLRNDPYSRRHILTTWNPEQLECMALPPCHMLACFTVLNGKLHCSMTQRSCDLFLGVPFNIASYSLMTHIMANDLGLEPGTFTWFGHDCHLYETHLDAATTQIDRIPYAAPTIALPPRRSIFDITIDEIKLQNYRCHPKIDAPMSV